jgi:UDP:flavonoid glycosyltransferase YjiC (YdhE family)
MRVLVSCTPGLGHLHPVVPLAEALRAAGHDVAFATSASFVPTIEELGFPAFPVGPDWVETHADDVLPGFLSTTPDQHIRLFADISARGTTDDLAAVIDAWHPHVVVRTPVEYAAWPAAERTGRPHVVVGFMVPLPRELVALWAGDELRALLEGADAEPDPALARLWGDLYVDLMPPALLPPDWPLPEVHQVVRPSIAAARTRTPPAWLGDYERPVVLVTFGTIFNHRPELWARTAEAVADLPVDVVATYGHGRPVPDVGPVPSNLRFEAYVDLAALLPSCAAVVTHGGYGTVVAALLHGVPLCCIPVTADNPANAYTLEQAGAGLACTTGLVEGFPFGVADPAILSTDAIRDALTRLLDDPSYRRRAQELGSTIAGLPDLDVAVDRIAALVT